MGCLMRRKPHAVLDLDSRRKKALKIERLLNLSERPQPLRLLEIGTGSGGIAHYFATHPKLQCIVTAVDVVDQRTVKDGFEFRLVRDTNLPFRDGVFHVVLSNHVIEHVGELEAQKNHLREMRRVMRTDGVGYLATPNRWMVVEPHYRLPFLSWLPRPMRHRYVRSTKKGEYYDCEPLSFRLLERYLEETGFLYQNLTEAAVRETLRLESGREVLATWISKIPASLTQKLNFLAPTIIYRLRQRG
ncbi:MAG: class I SAM-dependent methyltransferase [Desulfacinum sp.]|nr:class I SAM-dependent methyltransferase [Desulfacinum sp.]